LDFREIFNLSFDALKKKGQIRFNNSYDDGGKQSAVLRRFYLETMKSFSLLAFIQINRLLFIVVSYACGYVY
jgi:hypothetical protein